MRKFLLATAFAVLGFMGVQAQNTSMEAGPYLGIPVGDSDGFSFNAGATFGYYFHVIPDRLKVGGVVGVDHFFGKEYDFGNMTIDGEDATFIPIAASAKFNFTERFFAGLELGYAIGVSDGAGDGGFLARPRIGMSLPMLDLFLFYKHINYAYSANNWDWDDDGYWDFDDNWSVGSIGVGANFRF
jgi:hypothetical protein